MINHPLLWAFEGSDGPSVLEKRAHRRQLNGDDGRELLSQAG